MLQLLISVYVRNQKTYLNLLPEHGFLFLKVLILRNFFVLFNKPQLNLYYLVPGRRLVYFTLLYFREVQHIFINKKIGNIFVTLGSFHIEVSSFQSLWKNYI